MTGPRRRGNGHFQPRGRILLAAVDFFPGQLAIAHRVDTDNTHVNFFVGDGLNLQRVETAEVSDLLKCECSIFDEPYGSRLGHKQLGHG